jgi:hypothetical protein
MPTHAEDRASENRLNLEAFGAGVLSADITYLLYVYAGNFQQNA